MASGPPGITHPAKIFVLLALLTMLLAFLLALIAIFVPWSCKERNGGANEYRVGLFHNWDRENTNLVDRTTRWNNDLDAINSVTGGSKKCRGYFLGTTILTILGLCWALISLCLLAALLTSLWTKPLALAICTLCWLWLTFALLLAAWALWIVFAETTCLANDQFERFPTQGYCWGFILTVIASFLTLLASLFLCCAIWKILRFKPYVPEPEPLPIYPEVEQPVYVQETPVYVTQAVAPSYPVANVPLAPVAPAYPVAGPGY